ncbi:MAG: fumarate hydratase [Mucilaginibacter sp.]|nr:fumarate hydratase [Mucilaginibacter sp.]
MRPSFSFRLLPFTLKLALSFLLLALTSSCWFNPNVQGKGEVYLQGEWRQDSVPNQKRLLEYSLYHLKFSCDSFFIQVNSFSKVNNGPDTCSRGNHWSEYIKGTYIQRNDTLHLKGLFCNPDYSLKEDGGCLRTGVYEEAFRVSKKNDSVMQFASTSNIIPINAHLIKHTTCNPKPL